VIATGSADSGSGTQMIAALFRLTAWSRSTHLWPTGEQGRDHLGAGAGIRRPVAITYRP